MAKKVIVRDTPVLSLDASAEIMDEGAYQTIKGIQYLRPKIFTMLNDGNMGWMYDVENNPSDGSENS
jgi:hypothetical protein